MTRSSSRRRKNKSSNNTSTSQQSINNNNSSSHLFNIPLKICLPTLIITYWFTLSYITSLAVSLLCISLNFLLTEPDRSISKNYYSAATTGTPRVIVLTGSASGMSQRLTQHFIQQGHYVCATDIRIDALKQQHANQEYDGRVMFHKLDVASPEDWKSVISQVIEKWQHIDLHFNIAGVLFPHKIQDATTREIDLQIDVNIKGVVYGTREVAKAMLDTNHSGHIVNFSSMGGLATVSGVTLYACTKFAVRGFSMACSKDLAKDNIAVTCFMPDAVQTPMVDLQLTMEESAMAFSGDVLSLDQVENAICNEVIITRPVEYWLSSRANLARFGDIFGSSRAVAMAENSMKSIGIKKQQAIQKKMSQKKKKKKKMKGNNGVSILPDQTSSTSVSFMYRFIRFLFVFGLILITCWVFLVDHQQLETSEEVVSEFDIVNKTYLVTGGSSGIGKETVKALVNGGANVIIASRNKERGMKTVNEINNLNYGINGNKNKQKSKNIKSVYGKASFEHLDLNSFDSLNRWRGSFHLTIPLDGVVLNAGLITPSFHLNKDGIEKTLMVNHLGHLDFITALLERKLLAGNIVSVSSYQPARHSNMNVLHYENQSMWPFFLPGAYGVSKQASISTGRILNKKYSNKYLHVHPGWCSTNIGVDRKGTVIEVYGTKIWWWLASHFVRVKTVSEAASTSLRCLLDGTLDSGYYYDGKKGTWPKKEDNNENVKALAERNKKDLLIWIESINLIRNGRNGVLIQQKNEKTKTKKNNKDNKKDVGNLTSKHENGKSSNWMNSIYVEIILCILFHLFCYFILFTGLNAINLNQCGRKINNKRIDPVLLQKEKYRCYTSAVVDALYCVWILRSNVLIFNAEIEYLSLIGWIFFVVVWTDLHFYVTHRLMHMNAFVYQNIHYMHHESHNPNIWSSLSFHPMEACIFFSAYLICLYISLPMYLFYGFKLGMVLGPIQAHCGYDLGKIVKGPAHHYLHHSLQRGNFGGFPTGIWDKLFGTEIVKEDAVNGKEDNDVGVEEEGVEEEEESVTTDRTIMSKFKVYFKGIVIVVLFLQFLDEVNVSCYWSVLVLFVLWIALLDGALVVFPPKRPSKQNKIKKPRKVFVIGLSRTGTTSITEALNQMGLQVHHFCGKLVRDVTTGKPTVVKKYAAAFDGHTDIATVLVMEELKTLYPDCRFIHTIRDKNEWSEAMIKFVSVEPRKTLFRYHPTPRTFYDAAYGPNEWWTHTMQDWRDIHTAHYKRVKALKLNSDRLLAINICQLGKSGNRNKEMWNTIGHFLNVNDTIMSNVIKKKFPHRYVFTYSACDQPIRQINYLLKSTRSTSVILILFSLVFLLRFWDSGQCTRACRVENGQGNPDVLGRTGNWFDTKYDGYRIGWNKCQCVMNDDDGMNTATAILKKVYVERLHVPIQTKDQWWFKTSRVCGNDRKQYASMEAAKHKGKQVLNCGQCSKCSSKQNVGVMHEKAMENFGLTKRASVAAVGWLIGGKRVHQWLFQSKFIGFDEECSECWYEATRCNIASCAQYCLFGWTNPLSSSNTLDGDGGDGGDGGYQLNKCMECDEVYCSAYYLQSCGANRRTSGVVTDIKRREEFVCMAAKERWEKTQD